MKTDAERFPGLVIALQKAIIDRLKAVALQTPDSQGKGVYVPSAPQLRVAAIGAIAEVAEAEAEPVSARLLANVLFAVCSVNESAHTQGLERLEKAGQLPFAIKRGSKAIAKGYVAE